MMPDPINQCFMLRLNTRYNQWCLKFNNSITAFPSSDRTSFVNDLFTTQHQQRTLHPQLRKPWSRKKVFFIYTKDDNRGQILVWNTYYSVVWGIKEEKPLCYDTVLSYSSPRNSTATQSQMLVAQCCSDELNMNWKLQFKFE